MIPLMTSAASPARPARILIVDDSAVMRSLLRSVVGTDTRLEVVGTASDGMSALRAMDALCPDLILLDVEMPVMDGLGTLKAMKSRARRVPVIMCSSLTQRGAKVTIEALASGAADYVTKPAGQASRDAAIATLAQDLIPKILALTASSHGIGHSAMVFASGTPAAARSVFPGAPVQPPSQGLPAASSGVLVSPLASHLAQTPPAVVLIGVSTGGPAALDVVLPSLPASFPLPVLIVQHMPELFTKLLAERLDGRCPMHVVEATSGEPVRPGTVYIAKGNWHMEVLANPHASDRNAPVLHLTQEAAENHCRPSVDVLFRTAVPVYGPRILGVILTGMGSDGLGGCRLIRQHGGTIFAQDQATSAVWGMPGAVAQAGLAHRVLPLPTIASEILRLAGRGQREAYELRESMA